MKEPNDPPDDIEESSGKRSTKCLATHQISSCMRSTLSTWLLASDIYT